MGCFGYGGQLRMLVDESSWNPDDVLYANPGEYPFSIPRVYIEGWGAQCWPQYIFSCENDAVIMVRSDAIVEYTKTNYTELLAEDENGNLIWVDARNAPNEGCWGGKYLDEYRGGHEYSVVEYDLEALEKKTYKVVCEKTTEFDLWDVNKIMALYGEEEFCRDFTIKNHKVQRRVSNVGDNC